MDPAHLKKICKGGCYRSEEQQLCRIICTQSRIPLHMVGTFVAQRVEQLAVPESFQSLPAASCEYTCHPTTLQALLEDISLAKLRCQVWCCLKLHATFQARDPPLGEKP